MVGGGGGEGPHGLFLLRNIFKQFTEIPLVKHLAAPKLLTQIMAVVNLKTTFIEPHLWIFYAIVRLFLLLFTSCNPVDLKISLRPFGNPPVEA